MEHYVLDTNLFFNMEAGLSFGKTTDEVINAVIKIAKDAKASGLATFYMPPRVADELQGFFRDREENTLLPALFAEIVVKAPETAGITFPAHVFYKLVDDIRNRSYRGLQIAEDEVERTGMDMMGKEVLPKIQFQKTIGLVIKNLRMRYRNATRTGFLDSVADLDLIVLAKELNGTIVSTDEGVLVWAREFGVREMSAPAFGKRFRA